MATRMQDADQSSAVAIFTDHSGAEGAIRDLKKAGFDITKLSLVGRDYQAEDGVVGFYKTGDRMKYWGKLGAFWARAWGQLAGAAFLIIPGVGPVLVAGPMASWVIGALECAIFVGGLSAFGAGLISLGIPRDKALKYESSVKAGKFLLISHGTDEEAIRVKPILEMTEAEEIGVYELPPEPVRAA